MSARALNVVKKKLRVYADRGVFRGFDEVASKGGRGRFRFVWIGNRPLDLSVDTEQGVLRFNNVLPNLPSNSPLYSELKAFLRGRSGADLPAHRRVDARRAEVACLNRGGNVSIALKVKNNEYAYGINRLVNVVHEVFVHLNDFRVDYMYENFDVPQE
jgi:hypothetical protein